MHTLSNNLWLVVAIQSTHTSIQQYVHTYPIMSGIKIRSHKFQTAMDKLAEQLNAHI